ncbi:hypothetical protein [Methylobacterium indicum]|uniref:Uncharacterized protein n=1 Tax=Methylobacterium indicum TaxID=1775910 RepID=A0A8H8WXT3_9HYPH|nr:hypothetical protein [Methylobacterium indicum]BCM86483.1 hypothetical protein mvi_49440 [Methylobacterium indicum]
MSIRKIARNARQDDVLELFKPLALRIQSENWDVHAHQSQFERLLASKAKGSLMTYSVLKPLVFAGFKKVVVASACMQETMFYRLSAAQRVKLKPVSESLRRNLRYQQHEHGERVTFYYACQEAWSKTYRDTIVEDEVTGLSMKVLDQAAAAILNLFAGEPFIWMGNTDLPNNFFDEPGIQSKAERLPNTPHGLNDYQGFHNVVVLSALNPPPAHFHFLESYGISGEEVRTAHYRTAVYQAVMRCSIRNPADATPKRVVVMDRDTAGWMANLFAGAAVEPLPGMGVVPRKGKAGRPRQHASNADKTRAHRARQEMEWLAQLDLINETSVVIGRYPDLAREVRAGMSEFACNENTYKEGDIVTLPASSTSGSAFATIYDRRPLAHVNLTDDDSFITGLRDLHQRVVAKEESGVFSPAHFEPTKAAETDRGLGNITHLRGIWLDNDGGDLDHAEFAALFPYLRVVVWNTASSTPEEPRWRAFIPTTCAMSIEVHGLILNQAVKVLNRAGYYGDRQLKKRKRPGARRHGFDESKFTAASLFYLPCQARDPEGSFFIDYGEGNPKRGPLDVRAWIDNCILDLRRPGASSRTQASMKVEIAPTAPALPNLAIKTSAALRMVREKLHEQQTQSLAGQRDAMIAKAVEMWRSTPRGDGHRAFFGLAAALKRAGLDEFGIKAKLYEEAQYGHSPRERRGEIKDLLQSLRKVGTFTQGSANQPKRTAA